MHTQANNIIQRDKSLGTSIERKFAAWADMKGITGLTREVQLIEGRKFRFDFVHMATRTAIETHGATFAHGKSGHNSGMGIERDAIKMILAQSVGFFVWPLTVNQLKDPDHMELLRRRLLGMDPGVREDVRFQQQKLFYGIDRGDGAGDASGSQARCRGRAKSQSCRDHI